MTEAAKQAIERVRKARALIPDVRDEVARIKENPDRSEEWKSRKVGETVEAARAKVSGYVEEAQKLARTERRHAEEAYSKMRTASGDELAHARAVLTPVLSAAAGNPNSLLNLYQRRHSDNAFRQIIEETADAMIDAQMTTATFPERWHQLRQQVEADTPPEQAEARKKAEDAKGLQDYLQAARNIPGIELEEIAEPGEGINNRMNSHLLANSHAAANTFESGFGETSRPDGASSGAA